MSTTAPTTRNRLIVAGAFALIPAIGYLDGITSVYVAFSIFYVVPIFLVVWFGSRLLGIVAAAAAALSGLGADLLSIDARPLFAFVNVANRLALFVVVAIVFDRLQEGIDLQRRLAEQQREIRELQTR
jgi:hypothetical protein